MENRKQYILLAEIFRYPGKHYAEKINECAEYLKVKYPESYEHLKPFVSFVNTHNAFDVEEIFGKTFHIQAICYLDLGYVLFAEDYKRGEFLVQMKKEQEKINNECGEELADNLPNVLSLMAKMEDMDFLDEFAVRIVKPALGKMLQEFDESRIELKEKVRRKKQKVLIMEDAENKNIYQHAIEALAGVVKKDFDNINYDDPDIVPTLGGSVGTILSGNCGTSCAPQPAATK